MRARALICGIWEIVLELHRSNQLANTLAPAEIGLLKEVASAHSIFDFDRSRKELEILFLLYICHFA